jgi:branched-chain amino acid transport system permease protein
MQTLGFNTKKYLRTAFTLSALVPGILGGFTGAYYGYIDPKYFELFFSLNYAIAIIIGGLASIRGSLIGAVILVTIPEALRFIGLPNTIIGPTQQIIFCSILIVLIYLKPKGIFGDYQI